MAQRISEGSVVIQKRDGWEGMPEYAPFDVIHVGASVKQVPEPLLDQLASGGRMIIPVGKDVTMQTLSCFEKSRDGKNIKRRYADY